MLVELDLDDKGTRVLSEVQLQLSGFKLIREEWCHKYYEALREDIVSKSKIKDQKLQHLLVEKLVELLTGHRDISSDRMIRDHYQMLKAVYEQCFGQMWYMATCQSQDVPSVMSPNPFPDGYSVHADLMRLTDGAADSHTAPSTEPPRRTTAKPAAPPESSPSPVEDEQAMPPSGARAVAQTPYTGSPSAQGLLTRAHSKRSPLRASRSTPRKPRILKDSSSTPSQRPEQSPESLQSSKASSSFSRAAKLIREAAKDHPTIRLAVESVLRRGSHSACTRRVACTPLVACIQCTNRCVHVCGLQVLRKLRVRDGWDEFDGAWLPDLGPNPRLGPPLSVLSPLVSSPSHQSLVRTSHREKHTRSGQGAA